MTPPIERRMKNSYVAVLLQIVVTALIAYGVITTTMKFLERDVEAVKIQTTKNSTDISELKTDIKWIRDGIVRIENKVDKK